MKTRAYLLAGFLILAAGCGNKSENGENKQAVAPNIVHVDQLEDGAERLSIGQFLREQPKLTRLVGTSDPRITKINLKFHRDYSYTLKAYSYRQMIAFQLGTFQSSNGRLLLGANFGQVSPYKNKAGETCAYVILNASAVLRSAVGITACEEHFEYDDRDRRRRERRGRYY